MSVFRFFSAKRRGQSGWQGAKRKAHSAKGLRSLCLALAIVVPACRPQDAVPNVLDDAGDPLPEVRSRSRVVSLIPATTEILFALGAGDRVVGRTHWDGWPPEALQVPDLGDGIKPSIETVIGARPDLVLLYATGDNKAAATAFRAAGVDVISFRIDRIAEFERATSILGEQLSAQEQIGRAHV